MKHTYSTNQTNKQTINYRAPGLDNWGGGLKIFYGSKCFYDNHAIAIYKDTTNSSVMQRVLL